MCNIQINIWLQITLFEIRDFFFNFIKHIEKIIKAIHVNGHWTGFSSCVDSLVVFSHTCVMFSIIIQIFCTKVFSNNNSVEGGTVPVCNVLIFLYICWKKYTIAVVVCNYVPCLVITVWAVRVFAYFWCERGQQWNTSIKN